MDIGLMAKNSAAKRDKFGRELPARLLGSALEYLGGKELASSQRVCRGWKLPTSLLERAWRCSYPNDWEPDTAEAKEIAPTADALWLARCKRRRQLEANWRSGKCKRFGMKMSSPPQILRFCGPTLAIAADQDVLHIDLASRSVVKSVRASDIQITALACHGKLVFTGGFRGDVKSWLLPDLTRHKEYPNLHSSVYCLTTDGSTLIGATNGNSLGAQDVLAWSVESGEQLWAFNGSGAAIRTLDICSEQGMVYCGQHGAVRALRLRDGTQDRLVRLKGQEKKNDLHVLYNASVQDRKTQTLLIQSTARADVLRVPGLTYAAEPTNTTYTEVTTRYGCQSTVLIGHTALSRDVDIVDRTRLAPLAKLQAPYWRRGIAANAFMLLVGQVLKGEYSIEAFDFTPDA